MIQGGIERMEHPAQFRDLDMLPPFQSHFLLRGMAEQQGYLLTDGQSESQEKYDVFLCLFDHLSLDGFTCHILDLVLMNTVTG